MTSSRARRAYDLLPRPLQTAALNAYGLRNQAGAARHERFLRQIAPSEMWTGAQQREYVANRLRGLLEHAVDHVPRYRGLRHLLPDLRGSDADVMAVLGQFPRVTRAEILADSSAFLSNAFGRRELVATVTSGTTGTPMKTFLERHALDAGDALWWRRALWAGYERGDWTARLVGDHVVALSETAPSRPYRLSLVDRRIYLSTFHLDERTAGAIKELLQERKPAFLQGYPSALAALASLAGPCDTAWQPKAVLYSSEPMYSHQREAIAAFVEAPVRGLYGCAERIVSAAECTHGGLHLSVIDGYVEGQFGDACDARPALITGLLSRAMPLIRFELGDTLAFRRDSHCPCGRTLPLLDPVVTKVEDSVHTGSGRVISPSILTWAFKDLKGVRTSQIVQHADLSVEIRVVADPRQVAHIQRALTSRVGEMLFHEVPVSVAFVDKLDLTAAGKSRFVVSERGPSRAAPQRVGTPFHG